MKKAVWVAVLIVLALGALPGDRAACAECATSADCPPGILCRESRCTECLEQADCPPGTACAEGMCLPVSAPPPASLGAARLVFLPISLRR